MNGVRSIAAIVWWRSSMYGKSSCDVGGSSDSESQVICSSEGSCFAVNQSGDENDSRGGLDTGDCVGDDDVVNGVANGFSGE